MMMLGDVNPEENVVEQDRASHALFTTKQKLPSRGLVASYKLEALDPFNRPAEFLAQKYHDWREADTITPFFEWLGYQGIHRYVEYCDANTAKRLYLYETKHGFLANANNEPLNTAPFRGKIKGYAMYVIDIEGQLYCNEYRKDKFHHSSFLAGDRVASAGMLKTNQQGNILDINNRSGHYRPGLRELYIGITLLPPDVFAESATVSYEKLRFPRLVELLTTSQFRLVRWLGRVLNNCTVTTHLPVNTFKEWASTELERGKLPERPPSSRLSVRKHSPRSEQPQAKGSPKKVDYSVGQKYKKTMFALSTNTVESTQTASLQEDESNQLGNNL